ncbi:MAG: flagellar basal-body rod protein FlgG [bacterium]|nr:flagellar basal-body rod protein FlgG [bacterium]
MIKALSTAASGMKAQQTNVDAIANNLANVNTTGFKRSRVQFKDLLYQTLTPNQRETAAAGIKSIQLGHGVRIAAIQREFEQGPTRMTGNALDMTISGEGFFRVEMADGSYAYTRDGSFTIDADSTMVTSSGYKVAPGIIFPDGTQEVAVAEGGLIQARAGGEEVAEEIGTLEIYRFANPAGMRAIGGNLFVETEASGIPQTGESGAEGFGTVESGMLETSNVSVVEEMVAMIEAQRAYELNSKAIQTSEDMLALVNQLKR